MYAMKLITVKGYVRKMVLQDDGAYKEQETLHKQAEWPEDRLAQKFRQDSDMCDCKRITFSAPYMGEVIL